MRTRHPDDIWRVGDFLTLLKRGEKRRYFCNQCFLCGKEIRENLCQCGGHRCGRDLTDRILSLPNDTEDYRFACPRCGRPKLVNAGLIAFREVQESQGT